MLLLDLRIDLRGRKVLVSHQVEPEIAQYGMSISLHLLCANAGLFAILLTVKLVTKFVSVYPVSRLFLPREATYTTLLMSTGLTMGTISSMFRYQAGIINQAPGLHRGRREFRVELS